MWAQHCSMLFLSTLNNLCVFCRVYKVHKIQHFHKCICILSIFLCSLSGPGLAPSVLLIIRLYTTLNLKACKINNASEASQSRKKCVTFLMGGSPEKRPYDVSREQNRYVTLPLIQILASLCNLKWNS